MKRLEINDNIWFTIPKGTKVIVPNPAWDGDDETKESHTMITLQLEEDLCVNSNELKGIILKEEKHADK